MEQQYLSGGTGCSVSTPDCPLDVELEVLMLSGTVVASFRTDKDTKLAQVKKQIQEQAGMSFATHQLLLGADPVVDDGCSIGSLCRDSFAKVQFGIVREDALQAVERHAKNLSNSFAYIRQISCEAIAEVGPTCRPELLLQCLHDSDIEVRISAVIGIMHMGMEHPHVVKKDFRRAACKFVRDRWKVSGQSRMEAWLAGLALHDFFAWSAPGSSYTTQVLINDYGKHGLLCTEELQHAQSLQRLAVASAASVGRFLTSLDWSNRCFSCSLLGELGHSASSDHVDAIARCATHFNSGVRWHACRALGKLGVLDMDRIRSNVAECLADSSVLVRQASWAGLSSYASARYGKAFKEGFPFQEGAVRDAAKAWSVPNIFRIWARATRRSRSQVRCQRIRVKRLTRRLCDSAYSVASQPIETKRCVQWILARAYSVASCVETAQLARLKRLTRRLCDSAYSVASQPIETKRCVQWILASAYSVASCVETTQLARRRCDSANVAASPCSSVSMIASDFEPFYYYFAPDFESFESDSENLGSDCDLGDEFDSISEKNDEQAQRLAKKQEKKGEWQQQELKFGHARRRKWSHQNRRSAD